MASLAILSSCQNQEEAGFDKQTFDISYNGDNSLKAMLDLVNGRYALTIVGSGKSKDFSERSKAPWYSISRKINSVDIQEGVTSLGANIFNKIALTTYTLPASITSISDTSFKDGTSLYSLGTDEISGGGNCDIYYYSAEAPTDNSKTYWHYINNQAVLWKNIKTLFIGNSFTYYNDMPLIAQSIAVNLGFSFSVDSVTVGSHRLEQFADSTDEYGKIVDDKLANNQYDYIVLQEQSTKPLSDYAGFLAGAKALQKKINSTQVNCTIRLYSTWAYTELANSYNYSTIPDAEKAIRDKYDEAAKSLGVNVHYVGKAFTECYQTYSSINLYASDNKHPSYDGSYLAALVHVGNILKTDVRTTSFIGNVESEDVATSLKAIAYKAISNS